MLPLPVKSNKFKRNVKDLDLITYYRQIAEEMLEAQAEAVNATIHSDIPNIHRREAEELVDLITCCITRLEIIGYDEQKRQEMYNLVNEKNRKRGYFEEV